MIMKCLFKIQLKNLDSLQQWNFNVTKGKAIISNETSSFVVNENDSLVNDYFSLIVSDLSSVNGQEYIIRNTSMNNSTMSLKKRVTAKASSNRGEIINLGIVGTNKKRNEAILNTLIEILIEDRIADQRQLSKASIRFIDERLKSLQNNIDSISKLTITYQLNNNIYDTDKQTSTLLSEITKKEEALFNLKVELDISTSLLNQLKSQENFEILPANIGIVDTGINELLVSYNTLVMERNTLLVSATKNSPLVMEMNRKLNNLKKANLEGISRYIENLQVSLSSYQKINKETMGIVSGLPKKGYTMRTLAREFKFAEDLLVFLSQRKEEASISYVSVLPNLKVLSYGNSNNSPISPVNEYYVFWWL